eukprot:762028-Hanusia_phi.AAC.6
MPNYILRHLDRPNAVHCDVCWTVGPSGENLSGRPLFPTQFGPGRAPHTPSRVTLQASGSKFRNLENR